MKLSHNHSLDVSFYIMGGSHNSHSTAQKKRRKTQRRVEMGIRSFVRNCNDLGIVEHHMKERSAENVEF